MEIRNTTEETHVRFELPDGFAGSAYHAVPPADRYANFRDEAVRMLKDLGVDVKYHHHEAGRAGQQEIEGLFSGLLEAADRSVLVRYVLRNLAARHGYRLTFMPKPLHGCAGNSWHCHQYLTHAGKNLFYKAGGPTGQGLNSGLRTRRQIPTSGWRPC